MDILYYMPRPHHIESHGMRTHIIEVLGNLHKMGHSIRFADGSIYSPADFENLLNADKVDRPRILLSRVIAIAAVSPLKSEAWLLWNLIKETKVFIAALKTVKRYKPQVIYWRDSHFNSDYIISRLFHVPLVKEVNTIGIHELKITLKADRFTLWLYKIIQRNTMGKADGIIVVTPEIKRLLQEEYRIDPGKMKVIQNGANTDLFRPMDRNIVRKKLGLSQDELYICFVGLLREWQGVEYILKALPLVRVKYPGIKLLIVGDGPLREELYKIARQKGVSSSVIFTGGVPYNQVPYYINASDICVAPFIKELNKKGALCSLKMHEYMACGKPCVISKLQGIEQLHTDRCVVAVEPENAAELADTIITLLRDEELRKQIGENGRRYITQSQSWEIVSQRVFTALSDIVQSYKRKDEFRNCHEYETE